LRAPAPSKVRRICPASRHLRNFFSHPFGLPPCRRAYLYRRPPDTPEEITDNSASTLRAATFNSGHHTASNTLRSNFGLENVSRQFVWSFLTLTPSTISEQQSQRYVRMDRVQSLVPHVDLYFNEFRQERFTNKPSPAPGTTTRASSLTRQRQLARFWRTSGVSVRIPIPSTFKKSSAPPKKRAMKSPYVFPSQHTRRWSTPSPASCFIASGAWPPHQTLPAKPVPSSARWSLSLRISTHSFSSGFGTEPLDELPEFKDSTTISSAGEAFAREFDAKLNGKTSKLLDYSPNAARIIAESYRAVLGLAESQCSDAHAIDRLLNPSKTSIAPKL